MFLVLVPLVYDSLVKLVYIVVRNLVLANTHYVVSMVCSDAFVPARESSQLFNSLSVHHCLVSGCLLVCAVVVPLQWSIQPLPEPCPLA